jgi:hypothetical protein
MDLLSLADTKKEKEANKQGMYYLTRTGVNLIAANDEIWQVKEE